jgi:hypothetical protein
MEVQSALGSLECEPRLARQPLGEGDCLVEELVGGNDAIRESQSLCLLRGDPIAREQVLLGLESRSAGESRPAT